MVFVLTTSSCEHSESALFPQGFFISPLIYHNLFTNQQLALDKFIYYDRIFEGLTVPLTAQFPVRPY